MQRYININCLPMLAWVRMQRSKEITEYISHLGFWCEACSYHVPHSILVNVLNCIPETVDMFLHKQKLFPFGKCPDLL